MKKPTPAQSEVLEMIERGKMIVSGDRTLAPSCDPARIREFQFSRDGFDVLAHRTVRRRSTDNPRTDFAVEMFRISPEGAVRRI